MYITSAKYWNSLHFNYIIYYALPELERVRNSPDNYPVTGGHVDISKYRIRRFESGDEDVKKLQNILTMPHMEVPVSACIPIYRDAIIFYNNAGGRVSVLNICFECWEMKTDTNLRLTVDSEVVYPALWRLFDSWNSSFDRSVL